MLPNAILYLHIPELKVTIPPVQMVEVAVLCTERGLRRSKEVM